MNDTNLEEVARRMVGAMQTLVMAFAALGEAVAAWARSLPPELLEALQELADESAERRPLTTDALRELCAGAGDDGSAVKFDSEGGFRVVPSVN